MTSPLPELPKRKKKKEAKVSPRIFKWLEENWPRSALIEIKIKGNKVKPHQQASLDKVANGCFSYKIPDMGGRTCGDGFLLKKDADPLVVIYEGNNFITVINTKTNEKIQAKI